MNLISKFRDLFAKLKSEEVLLVSELTGDKMLVTMHTVENAINELKAFVASPEGKTIEQLASEIIPASQPYTDEAIKVITELGSGLQTLVDNPHGQKSLLIELAVELIKVIDGGVKITSLAEAMTYVEQLFD